MSILLHFELAETCIENGVVHDLYLVPVGQSAEK
jgi:hypothetical protein